MKTLHESGYHTMADLSSATVSMLASIRGISWEKALAMKNIANNMTNQVRQGLKIRLSVDEKTPGATALVSALHHYQKEQPCAKNLPAAAAQYGTGKDRKLDSEPASGNSGCAGFYRKGKETTGGGKRIIILSGLLAGDYSRKVHDTITSFQTIEKGRSRRAWRILRKIPSPFLLPWNRSTPGFWEPAMRCTVCRKNWCKKSKANVFSPEGLCCQLRRYQEWGVKYILHQKRVLCGR